MRRFASLISLAFLIGACDSEEAPNPKAVIGDYKVSISAGTKSDPDVLHIVEGADQGLVLSFAVGVSPLSTKIQGSTKLSVARQSVTVQHSTGAVTGVGYGSGTIAADGTLEMELNVDYPTLAADGGVIDGGALDTKSYTITGARQ